MTQCTLQPDPNNGPSARSLILRYFATAFTMIGLLALAILTFDLLLGDNGDDFWHELTEIAWLPAVYAGMVVSPKSSCGGCAFSRAIARFTGRLVGRRPDRDVQAERGENPYAHNTPQ